MAWQGILIGAGAFLIIGLLHPVVIKAEYHLGRGIWPAFLAAGFLAITGSLLVRAAVPSALLAILGFSLLWCIRELAEQEERVRKGWFPVNPKREKNTVPQSQTIQRP